MLPFPNCHLPALRLRVRSLAPRVFIQSGLRHWVAIAATAGLGAACEGPAAPLNENSGAEVGSGSSSSSGLGPSSVGSSANGSSGLGPTSFGAASGEQGATSTSEAPPPVPGPNAGSTSSEQASQSAASPSDDGVTSGEVATLTTEGASHGTDLPSGTSGDPEPIDADALFVAPNGEANALGSLDAPTTLESAVSKVAAGRTIYLRGGTYVLSRTVGLVQSGTEAAPITLRAYPSDTTRPKLDFSQMAEDSGNRGVTLSGSYWHVSGIDVYRAGDNCLNVSGSHNIIEYATFSECADTGLQLGGGASDNLIKNCDSFFNADSSLENADGFAAKLDVGSGNKFVGCRAWNNLDDGWDGYLRPADNVTTSHENCWAIDNGKLKDGSVGAGDGNGFKTGGSDDKNLSHNAHYAGCIAAGNVNDGFDHNSNRGSVTILNSAAHGNGTNINFSASNIAASLTVKNTISLGTNGGLNANETDISNNSWQDGREATEADFVSVDIQQLKAPRKADGSLPDVQYLKLTTGSDLRDAGTDVGLPFLGSAPDIGPFEINP